MCLLGSWQKNENACWNIMRQLSEKSQPVISANSGFLLDKIYTSNYYCRINMGNLESAASLQCRHGKTGICILLQVLPLTNKEVSNCTVGRPHTLLGYALKKEIEVKVKAQCFAPMKWLPVGFVMYKFFRETSVQARLVKACKLVGVL